MDKIKIKGVELEIDLMDADVMETIETAVERVKTGSAKIQADKTMKNSQGIRAICHLVFECFNAIFGEGTDKKIFGGRTNMTECLEAFAEFCTQAVQQPKDTMAGLMAKYSPARLKK